MVRTSVTATRWTTHCTGSKHTNQPTNQQKDSHQHLSHSIESVHAADLILAVSRNNDPVIYLCIWDGPHQKLAVPAVGRADAPSSLARTGGKGRMERQSSFSAPEESRCDPVFCHHNDFYP